MTSISGALLGVIAIAAACSDSTSLRPRACVMGSLVCNGNSKFGICDMDSEVVWMTVADGTECVCSGSTCIITTAYPDARVESTQPLNLSHDSFKNNPAFDSVGSFTYHDQGINTIRTKLTPDMVHSRYSAAVVQVSTFITAPYSSSIAVASNSSLSLTVPITTTSQSPVSPSGPHYVFTFLGNGDPSQGWPQQSQWVSFRSMWSANLANVISKSCEAFGQTNNSQQENVDLKSAIQSVAKSSGVDERFVLAVVMQESGGCVRAPTSNNGIINPGLMQSHDGAHSCYNVNPCPSGQIVGMIGDGTTGTPSGDGLQQILVNAGSGVGRFYRAARIYNSGSIATSGLLQDGIATHCYASDVANRLIGWSSGVSGCTI